MNSKGGGIVDNNIIHSSEMKIFNGGFRNIRRGEWRNTIGTKESVRDMHDMMSYERVGRSSRV
jgi:hypothetical protein